MSAFVQELFHVGVYKRNQGRVARQVTFAAVFVLVTLGVWRLSESARPGDNELYWFWIPTVLWMIGIWIGYRLVNLPAFADFLISVEAEMNKVSWPSRGELIRSSLVVMFTIFFLAAILFLYDLFWKTLLEGLGILN